MSQFQILGRRPFPFKAVPIRFADPNCPGTIRFMRPAHISHLAASPLADIANLQGRKTFTTSMDHTRTHAKAHSLWQVPPVDNHKDAKRNVQASYPNHPMPP